MGPVRSSRDFEIHFVYFLGVLTSPPADKFHPLPALSSLHLYVSRVETSASAAEATNWRTPIRFRGENLFPFRERIAQRWFHSGNSFRRESNIRRLVSATEIDARSGNGSGGPDSFPLERKSTGSASEPDASKVSFPRGGRAPDQERRDD